MQNPRKELFDGTLKQERFAALLRVSPQTVLRWRKAGVLTACKGTTIKVVPALVELTNKFRAQLEARSDDEFRSEKIRKLKTENDARDKKVVEWSAVHALHQRLYGLLTETLRRELVYQMPTFSAGRDVHDIRLVAKVSISQAIGAVRVELQEWSTAAGPDDRAVIESVMNAFQPVVWPGKAPPHLPELMAKKPARKAAK